MSIKVKQLGNGGGFDFHMTNSAFLINYDGIDILFDCGFNVMAKLHSDDSIDIEAIENVFISHMDEDHIGNLKMFIYWRYFNYNKITKVICNRNIEDDLQKYLCNLNTELLGCQSVDAYMFNITTTSYGSKLNIGNIILETTRCNHGKIPTSGAIFRAMYKKKIMENSSIFISADTKASKYIEEISYDCDIIFHDFSNWDFVTRNVHTCKTDFELEYSEEYRNKVIKYHNGSFDFNKEWRIC